jgi:uncharacterized protein (TIGR02996 family)
MSDHENFLQAIRAAPDDQLTRLVYADYLEERGDERGGYLRIQAMLLQAAREGNQSTKELQESYMEMRSRLEPSWLQATDWPAPKPKSAIRCVFGIMHSWDGCVCRRCGTKSKDPKRHAWVGCMCIRCGDGRGRYGECRLRLPAGGCRSPKAVQCSICGCVCHEKVVDGMMVVERMCPRCSATWVFYPHE